MDNIGSPYVRPTMLKIAHVAEQSSTTSHCGPHAKEFSFILFSV